MQNKNNLKNKFYFPIYIFLNLVYIFYSTMLKFTTFMINDFQKKYIIIYIFFLIEKFDEFSPQRYFLQCLQNKL